MKRLLLILCCVLTFGRASAIVDLSDGAAIYLLTDTLEGKMKKQVLSTGATALFYSTSSLTYSKAQKRIAEYTNYLGKINNLLMYCAEIYGYSVDIYDLIQDIKGMRKVIDENPQNLLAAAINPRSSATLLRICEGGCQIVVDLVKIFDNEAHMTEYERFRQLASIRPRIRAISYKVRLLTRTIKFTSLIDVWYMIRGFRGRPKSNAELAFECRQRWAGKLYALRLKK